MPKNDNKQPPAIKYTENNFDKLAGSLKQNMLRRKQAGQNKQLEEMAEKAQDKPRIDN